MKTVTLKIPDRLYAIIEQAAKADEMAVEEWMVQEAGSGVAMVADIASEVPGLIDFDGEEAARLFRQACPNAAMAF